MTDTAAGPTRDVGLDEAVSVIRDHCVNGVETVLLDGPSGAGKSTLADALVAAWAGEVTLVRMDNLYPGWGGLAAGGEHVHDHLLAPRIRATESRWRRHDWESETPAEWHTVPARRSLILEGCGVLTRANAPLATVRVWLDADDGVRKVRALARDHGGFDAHWDEWDSQFSRFLATESPAAAADVRLRLI